MKIFKVETEFGGTYDVNLLVRNYSNGTLAVAIVEAFTEEPFATLTVNLEPYIGQKGLQSTTRAFVKTYSENAWAQKFLDSYPEIATFTGITAKNDRGVVFPLYEFHPENF